MIWSSFPQCVILPQLLQCRCKVPRELDRQRWYPQHKLDKCADNFCKAGHRCNDTANTKAYIIFPTILVLVNSPIGRSGFVAVLSCKVRIFEYPHAPHIKERVSCEIRSNAMLPPVAHLGIGHYPPSRTLPSSKKMIFASRTLPGNRCRHWRLFHLYACGTP